MSNENVVYCIDSKDKLLSVNSQWDRFALDNSAAHLLSEEVVSRSLWDFISDPSTRFIYREMLKKVRAGRRVSFPFRCDSPDVRRFLEMNARLVEGDAVEFEVRTLALEPRPAQPLLDAAAKRTDEFLRLCSWCKKMPDGDGWIDIEEAVAKTRLFESVALPLISHGICEKCDREMNETIQASERPL